MDDTSSSSESGIAIDAPKTANHDAPNTATEAPPTASGDEEGKQQKKVPRRTHSVAPEDFVAKTIELKLYFKIYLPFVRYLLGSDQNVRGRQHRYAKQRQI